MSTRIRPFSAFFLVALLVLPCTASAWELRLTSNANDQSYPSISGTNVVWQDNRNGNWDIYLYDGMTGQTRQLTNNTKDQKFPQIAGRYVVWEDYRNSQTQLENPDIYLLDLQAGGEPVMVNFPEAVFGGYECHPAVSDTDGVFVTWIEKANGLSEQGRIFYRRIGDGSGPRQAYQDSNTQTGPWISGQKLVWTDTDLGGVYFRNLADPEPRILERMSNETITGIRSSGDRVIWSQYMDEKMAYNLRLCQLDLDLQNGTKRWISPSESFQSDPSIDGNLVVWSDDRNRDADLYIYDLAASEERPLVVADGQQTQTSIDGELVAFTDNRNGNNEIYLVSATNATPLLGVVAVQGGMGIPQDLNGDGTCEDVNGNGRKDFADIVLYFNQMSWISTNEPIVRFDFNGNGRIDFSDVVRLFNTL